MNYSEKDIVDGFKKQDRDILNFVMDEYYPFVRSFVVKNNGNEDDALSVFLEGLTITFHRLRDEDLRLTCKLNTFIFSVCKNLWLKTITYKLKRKEILYGSLEPFLVEEEDQAENIGKEELKITLFQRHFMDLPAICKKILTLFLEKTPYQEIAGSMGMKNPQYARKKKYRCLQRLIQNILKDPDYKRLKED
ncbi:MAG: hypothetical protein R6T99_11300 [Bacteroidales bacterium]